MILDGYKNYKKKQLEYVLPRVGPNITSEAVLGGKKKHNHTKLLYVTTRL